MSALAKSLLEFQKDAPQIRTDSSGNFNNKYVSLPALMDAIRVKLAEHGLMLIQKPTVLENGAPGLVTKLLHESGEEEQAVMPLMLDKQNPQGLGSAITYARRQAALAFLGLAADDDDDAHQASAPPRAAQPKSASVPPEVGGAVSGSEKPAPAPKSAFEPPPGAVGDGHGFNESHGGNVAPDDGGDPNLVRVHFGKNAGKTLGELTGKQREWYATTWTPNPQYENAQDRRLKRAAQILCGMQPDAEPVEDGVPF